MTHPCDPIWGWPLHHSGFTCQVSFPRANRWAHPYRLALTSQENTMGLKLRITGGSFPPSH